MVMLSLLSHALPQSQRRGCRKWASSSLCFSGRGALGNRAANTLLLAQCWWHLEEQVHAVEWYSHQNSRF